MLRMRRLLTFDDVGLIPKFNRISSRLNTNIQTMMGRERYNSPFIPANMDTVIGLDLAKVCQERHAPIIFHRFAPIEKQVLWIKEFPDSYASIGLHNLANLEVLYKAGCRKVCIDVAHGHSEMTLDTIKKVKEFDVEIIAGNVCTYHGVVDLVNAGASIIKVGIGPGAACTTRMMTAMGVPQFSAIQECYRAKKKLESEGISVSLIADGGIKNPRDAVLAIAAGADAVMMGSIFARTFESAMPKYNWRDLVFGRYRGQASDEFMNEYYGAKKRPAEGVAFEVEVTESAKDVFDRYEGGLQSALTYCGAYNLEIFRENAEIFESTSSYMKESDYRM
jgi:IMP dehydrogenase